MKKALCRLADVSSRRVAALVSFALLFALPAFGSEADLHLPALGGEVSLFGCTITGTQILVGGLVVCVFGLLFGVYIIGSIKKMPAHQSMLDVSDLIYRNLQNLHDPAGQTADRARSLHRRLHVLLLLRSPAHGAAKVMLILLWSVLGILGSLRAWPGSASASTPTPTAARLSPR